MQTIIIEIPDMEYQVRQYLANKLMQDVPFPERCISEAIMQSIDDPVGDMDDKLVDMLELIVEEIEYMEDELDVFSIIFFELHDDLSTVEMRIS